MVKHIDKWVAETEEAKEIAMILQHARAINRIDVLVWHNISNNITNNPPHAQAPGCGRGRGRGGGHGHGRGFRCMNVDPSTSTQLTPSTGDGPSVAPSTSAQPPPPTSVGPFGTPSSIAQPTPSTSACPFNDVASSTRKRHRVAPSPPHDHYTHAPFYEVSSQVYSSHSYLS